MTKKNNLTAWERWELATLEDDAHPAKGPPLHSKAAKKVEAEVPVVVEAPPPLPEVHMPTAEEVEQIHQQAHDDGYQEGLAAGRLAGHAEGHEEGYKTGHEEGKAKGEEAARHLMTIAEKLDTALAGMDGAVAEELTALAMEVAREVLRQTLALQPETVVGVVRDALLQLPHQHANIYLHPDDAALVRSYAGDQLSHAGHRIHEDPRLQRNDVSIEASGAHVDATMATRWRRVVETLGQETVWDGHTLPPLEPVPEPASEPVPEPIPEPVPELPPAAENIETLEDLPVEEPIAEESPQVEDVPEATAEVADNQEENIPSTHDLISSITGDTPSDQPASAAEVPTEKDEP
ncbi:MAG TPA: flagellar assembly protein FliH [Rhodocyclaceae bacterium]|jgi:flagellar assembly protein FliH